MHAPCPWRALNRVWAVALILASSLESLLPYLSPSSRSPPHRYHGPPLRRRAQSQRPNTTAIRGFRIRPQAFRCRPAVPPHFKPDHLVLTRIPAVGRRTDQSSPGGAHSGSLVAATTVPVLVCRLASPSQLRLVPSPPELHQQRRHSQQRQWYQQILKGASVVVS